MLKLSETIDDMEAYIKVTDDVIQHIKISNDDKLKEVRVSLYNHIDAFGSHVKQKYLELI